MQYSMGNWSRFSIECLEFSFLEVFKVWLECVTSPVAGSGPR